MKIKNLLFACIVFISSCSSDVQRRLEPMEGALETNGATTMLFHSSLYYPVELSIRFDGYLVGVEKSPVKKITHEDDIKISEVFNAGLTLKEARDKVIDKKILYVSHVINNFNGKEGMENCAIYNVYDQINYNSNLDQLVSYCDKSEREKLDVKNVYYSSWDALSRLEESMKIRISENDYTDIIVVTMGWNTVQDEAIRNFNSIIKNIKVSSAKKFNPLVIGVTWPSQWASDWFDPVIKLASFPVKAGDADELGLMWLGVLLHETIPNANKGIPVTVIGHSFGGRAAGVASCAGPAIYKEHPIQPKKIDNLLVMQGAFRVSRFFGGNENGIDFLNSCNGVKNVVLTSSRHDEAVKTAFWSRGDYYVGDSDGYLKFCGENHNQNNLVNCVTVEKNGCYGMVGDIAQTNITYVDASKLIFENAFLSGGGAHSDIYRNEHGKFMYGVLINSKENCDSVGTSASALGGHAGVVDKKSSAL